MNLSHKASKGLAIGLAASTILMTAAVGFIPSAFAAPHAEGCNVLSNGTVYYILGGQLRGFPSADVFYSWGNGFGGVQTATAEDLALPMGPVMVYADGTLVKGPNDPLVYLVSNGQKLPFTSGTVFTGLGFKFSNIQSAPANTFADLPTGANIDNATSRHTSGVWVIDSTGTVWRMTATGRVGLPSMAVFNSWGKSFSTVVPANAADLAANNEGVAQAKPSCSGGSTGGTGSTGVSLTGPASQTLVAGQALADLGDFNFSGSATITSFSFERIGVSANSTLANVYLFDGNTRLTDAASVTSDNHVNFNGVSITTPRTISVKADIASSTSGQTVGIKLDSFTAGSVTTTSVSGNLDTIASATLATTAIASAAGGGNNDPGNDVNVWQGTVTVGTRNVTLNRLALQQIGSASSSSLQNFRLYVDGSQVAQVSNLDSNNFVTFTPNSTMMSGTRVLKVLADIVGGSSRTYQMSLRGAYDLTTTDSNYNVPILATGTFPFGPAAGTINAGSLTVQKTSTSPSANVVVGASNVPVADYTFTAFGEPVKVTTLKVAADTNGTDSGITMRNVAVYVNGSQVGSTTDVPASDTMASGTSFTTNFTVNPGSPATVEIRSDMVDDNGTDDIATPGATTVQFGLLAGSSNGTPQVSLTPINVPTAVQKANTLTIAKGSLSLVKAATYPNQTVTTPQNKVHLGSFVLTGNATEDVNVNSATVDVTLTDTDASGTLVTDVSNLYLMYGSTQSPIKTTVAATGNSFSPNFTIAKNTSMTIDVYGDLDSAVTNTDTILTKLLVAGTTAQSGTAVNTNSGSTLSGQTITVGAGSITATLDPTAPVSTLTDDQGTVTSAAYQFAAVTDSYVITDLTVKVATCTAVSNIAIMDGSTAVANTPCTAGATNIVLSGLNIPVAMNTNKTLTVQLTMSTIGVGAGTSGSDLTTSLVAATARNTNGTSAAVSGLGSPIAGNAMYAYKAYPTLTAVTLPSSTLPNANSVVISKFTIDPAGTGTISWKKILFTVTKTSAPVLTNAHLFNSSTGVEVAGTATLTTVGSTNLSGTVKFVATNEQQITSGVTYELRMDIASSVAADSVTTSIGQPSSHASPAAYSDGTQSFGWSDVSAAGHSTSTSDWNNDNLVKNTGNLGQTLSR